MEFKRGACLIQSTLKDGSTDISFVIFYSIGSMPISGILLTSLCFTLSMIPQESDGTRARRWCHLNVHENPDLAMYYLLYYSIWSLRNRWWRIFDFWYFVDVMRFTFSMITQDPNGIRARRWCHSKVHENTDLAMYHFIRKRNENDSNCKYTY